jgi:hypothetical protein
LFWDFLLLFCFAIVINAVLFWFFDVGSHYVAEPDLELEIFLSLPPEFWDYRHVQPYLALKLNFEK